MERESPLHFTISTNAPPWIFLMCLEKFLWVLARTIHNAYQTSPQDLFEAASNKIIEPGPEIFAMPERLRRELFVSFTSIGGSSNSWYYFLLSHKLSHWPFTRPIAFQRPEAAARTNFICCCCFRAIIFVDATSVPSSIGTWPCQQAFDQQLPPNFVPLPHEQGYALVVATFLRHYQYRVWTNWDRYILYYSILEVTLTQSASGTLFRHITTWSLLPRSHM